MKEKYGYDDRSGAAGTTTTCRADLWVFLGGAPLWLLAGMVLLVGEARYATAQSQVANAEDRQLALTDWNGRLHVGSKITF